MRAILIALPLLLLAACTGTKADRYAIAPLPADERVRTDVDSISVAKITLPAYAKEPGIFVQNEAGALTAIPKADWADDTDRAMMLSLVRNLSDITNAEVASDPWPFGGVPEAELRVDVEQMLVDRTGTMRFSGQFSIRRDVAESRNRIRQFNITLAARSTAPGDVVQAHDRAWQQLAKSIAESM